MVCIWQWADQIKRGFYLKIGTNTLTKETNQISRGKIEDIGRQICRD